jgi:hypothetical protein
MTGEPLVKILSLANVKSTSRILQKIYPVGHRSRLAPAVLTYLTQTGQGENLAHDRAAFTYHFVFLEAILHLMSEWLYAQAGQIVPPDSQLWFKLLNHQLHTPTEAFCASFERLHKFWELAPHMMEITAVNIIAQYDVIFDAGKTYKPPSNEEAFKEMLGREIIARAEQKFKETGSLKEATGYDLDRGIKAFEQFVKRNTLLDGAVRAVLESQLTLSWTAFETLAEDAWKAALVCHPGCGAKSPYFRRLESIRETYRSLSPTSGEINAILSNPDLRKLNLVRNVLVHKSGIVDQQFLDGAAEIAWSVSDLHDQLIHIDGARVKELVNPVIRCGEELILAVDRWVTGKTQSQSAP